MKKNNEVLMRIDNPVEDVVIFPATDEKPAALKVWFTVMEGEHEGRRMKFYGRWGSENEQGRLQRAAEALGLDPQTPFSEITPDNSCGLGSAVVVRGALKKNDMRGWMEVHYIKAAETGNSDEYY